MNQRLVIGAGLAGLAALIAWKMRNTINLGLPNLLPASAKIAAFAIAIAKAEGFYVPNSIPAKTNNPGDLKIPGTPADQATSGGITKFATLEEGWSALYRQLQLIVDGKSLYKLDWTIRQMGAKYAPPSDRNQPDAWAKNVASALGVPVDTPLRAVLT